MKATWMAGILVGLLIACGQGGTASPSSATDGEGLASLSMSGTGSDGAVYRIVGWSLRFEGPESRAIPETEAETISVPLKTGAYTVALEGAWHVERADAPGVPVDVVLVSPNPLGFVVRTNEQTPVRFLFKLAAEGSATVTMGIDGGGWISGAFQVVSIDDPQNTHVFDELRTAQSLTFTISYASSQVQRQPPRTTLDAGPLTVQFGQPASAFLDGELAPALSAGTLHVDLFSSMSGIVVGVQPIFFMNGNAPDYELGLALFDVPGTLDLDGSPLLGAWQTAPTVQMSLKKGTTTAYLTGQLTMDLR